MTTTATTKRPRKPSKPRPALEPGRRHTMTVDGWHPATVNQIYGNGPRWWKGAKLKLRDRAIIRASAYLDKIPLIDPERPVRRRVSMTLTVAKGQRRPDKDGVWKSVLDALVHANVLRNDSPVWCDHTAVEYERSGTKDFGAVIVIEDL